MEPPYAESPYAVFNTECRVEYCAEHYAERRAEPPYVEPPYIEPAFIHTASGFRVVSRLVRMARHKIVVKWGDILVGRYFGEANFGRWRFGKYGPP